MESKKILEEMVSLWKTTGAQYRDGMLEVGRKIHLYILARLREGDGLNEAARTKARCFRAAATKDCMNALGVKITRLNEILRTAMCVEILSDGGDVGSLSLSAIRWFRVVIVRQSKNGKMSRGRRKKEGELDPSSAEVWQIRDDCSGWAKRLFSQAVKGGWTAEKVYQELRDNLEGASLKRMGQRQTPRGLVYEDREEYNPLCVIRDSNVKDAADMILEMINHSRDPATLRRILQEKLS